MEQQTAVEMSGIVKRYGDVLANDDIDFDVKHGEIHALLGENGAGKTTLMRILCGLVRQDVGRISISGREVSLRSPRDARSHGLGMVHQHFALVPTLTVAENFLMGTPGPLVTKGVKRRVATEISRVADQYGLDIDPRAMVWELSVGEQQRVEIVRALYNGARVLLLDEPTASLGPSEVDRLLERLRLLREGGASIVLVTHHLQEILDCADRVTVLRGGRRVGTVAVADTDIESLASLMVGSRREADTTSLIELEQASATSAPEIPRTVRASTPGENAAEALFQVRDLTVRDDRSRDAVRSASFHVRAGEIVAIAGVEGNGQSELEEALVGLRRVEGGHIRLNGAQLDGLSPAEVMAQGLGIIPSDRYRRALIGTLPIATNLTLDRFWRRPFSTRFRVNAGALHAEARRLLRRFDIRAPGVDVAARQLSGGNAQKVVLARVLSAPYTALVCAQPTRGLDVHASRDVYENLRAATARGVGVLLISTDLAEVFSIADRCYVMFDGRLSREYVTNSATYEEVGLAMGGHFKP
jgi:simple sugar transport system ATP-binding protein